MKMIKLLQVLIVVGIVGIILVFPCSCSGKGDGSAVGPETVALVQDPNSVAEREVVAVLAFRLDCLSGAIAEIDLKDRAIADWERLDNSNDAKAHLVLTAVDSNYDFVSETWPNQQQTKSKTAVRFGLSVENLSITDYFSCPRAIFVPMLPEGPNILLPKLQTADGMLNLDISSYGIQSPPEDKPYYYNHLTTYYEESLNLDWVIPPDKTGDVYDSNFSKILNCEMVIGEGNGVPSYVDWLVVIDGHRGTTAFGPGDVWLDPFKVDHIRVERNTPLEGFYDNLWDLDIIIPGQEFTIKADIFSFDTIEYENSDYSIFIACFGTIENGPWVPTYLFGPCDSINPKSDGVVEAAFPGNAGNNYLGLSPIQPSGMYYYAIVIRDNNSPVLYYYAKLFQIPFCNPQVTDPNQLYDAGYYIIGATASPVSKGDVNQLYLMNSFTREFHPCDTKNIKNISMQKAGLVQDDGIDENKHERMRVAYEYANGSQMAVGTWEWYDSGSGGIEENHTELYGGRRHAIESMFDEPGAFVPFISPLGNIVVWSGYDPSSNAKLGYDFAYKGLWRIYDGYASIYDCSLYNETPEDAPGTPYYFYQFDPDWLRDPPGDKWFPHRCGIWDGEDPNPPQGQDWEYADNTWLMEPSVGGPTHFNWLPGDEEPVGWDSVYVAAFSRSSDCGQETTALIIYYFQIKPSFSEPGKYRIELINESTGFSTVAEYLAGHTFGPENYWETPPNNDIQQYYIGDHSGYEDHLLNPVVSANGDSIVFESNDGAISRIYKIDLNKEYDGANGKFISDSQLVGHSPLMGAKQFKPVINTGYWDPYAGGDNLGDFASLPPIMAYQDGLDSGTDIWLAIQVDTTPPTQPRFSKINVTGPILDLNFHTFSGQPDIASRDIEFAGQQILRSGLVFISQEYNDGDLFLVDHVYRSLGEQHFTRIRRMSNLGDVMECQISDFIMASSTPG